MVGKSQADEARLLAELLETLLVIDAACEYFLTYD
jgi:hypothetical protein